MAYGTIKVDTVTFTDGGIDKSVTLSGLVQNPTFSGNVTVTGTLSGVTVTGTTASFTSGVFTSISGSTVVLTSGVFASGTAAAPSVSVGTTSNGIYSPGTNQLALSTSGTQRVQFGTGEVVFNDDGNNYDFRIEGDTVSNLFFVDASADAVGIGTTGPQHGLSLLQGNALGWVSGAGNAKQKIEATGTDGLEFYTGATPTLKATLDSSGRFLVGTSSARANLFNSTVAVPLQVEGTGTTTAGISVISNPGAVAGNSAVVVLGKTRSSSVGGTTVVASGDELGVLTFQGSDGTELVEGARISCEVDGTPGANDMPGRLVFSVTADGASSPSEAMRIKNSRILNFANTPVYADNAAAKTGGLVDGDVYRKSDGTLMIVYT